MADPEKGTRMARSQWKKILLDIEVGQVWSKGFLMYIKQDYTKNNCAFKMSEKISLFDTVFRKWERGFLREKTSGTSRIRRDRMNRIKKYVKKN